MNKAKKSRMRVRVTRAVTGVILVLVTLLETAMAVVSEDPPDVRMLYSRWRINRST